MMSKVSIVVLAALSVLAACSEREKRQSGMPDFNEYFNKFQEQMKPIAGQFPSLPNGFGQFPNFPGIIGGSEGSSGNSQYKRQINPNTMTEWFSQFQETGNNLSGNLPFKPPTFGQFPFPGTSSGSTGSSGNQNN